MSIFKAFWDWVEEKRRQVQFVLTVVTLFLTIATFLMAGFMFWQARILKNSVLAQRDSINAQKESIDIQIKELSLSKRPYVYVEIENVAIKQRIEVNPVTGNRSVHYMVTAGVKFKNEGTTPAVVNKISYFVTTNADKRHLDTPKYFIDNLGSYPYPTIVFPGQENLNFNYGADCSPSVERVYFNVVVSYEGYRDNTTTKTYWYSFISKYACIATPVKQKIQLPDGREEFLDINAFQIIKLEMKGEWDRNTDFDVPHVFEPNWLMEEEQVKKQREFLK